MSYLLDVWVSEYRQLIYLGLNMKDIKQQLPLPLDQPLQPTPKPQIPSRPRDTGGKAVPAGKLATALMKKLTEKKSRKVAATVFLAYQLIEMTISLANTL